MSPILRVLLIAGALLTAIFFVRLIRKRRLQIDHTIFWMLFSMLLLLIAIFPQIITWLAGILGFVSPANFVFLMIIFLLILRLFSVTLKISRLEQQVASLTQNLAIRDYLTQQDAPTLTQNSESSLRNEKSSRSKERLGL